MNNKNSYFNIFKEVSFSHTLNVITSSVFFFFFFFFFFWLHAPLCNLLLANSEDYKNVYAMFPLKTVPKVESYLLFLLYLQIHCWNWFRRMADGDVHLCRSSRAISVGEGRHNRSSIFRVRTVAKEEDHADTQRLQTVHTEAPQVDKEAHGPKTLQAIWDQRGKWYK